MFNAKRLVLALLLLAAPVAAQVGSTATDTGPSPDCSGTTTYQDGEGGCDDISAVYMGLAGGEFTAEFTADALGIEFEEGDAITDCSTFSATGGGIIYDDSEGVLKKCQDNVLTVLDTTGGTPAFSDISGATNTTAAMVVGTGASIGVSGSGTVVATTAAALAANGGNCSAGQAPLGVDDTGAVESCTDFEEDLSNSAGLLAALSDETGTGVAVFGTSPTIATPAITGKVDRNDAAVDDDDCTGEQGLWWYDDTDSVFEFCNNNSGAPAVLGAGAAAMQYTQVKLTSAQEISTTATWQAISWDGIVVDDVTGWAGGNPTRITSPATASHVRFRGGTYWEANSTGIRAVLLRQDGTAAFPDAIEGNTRDTTTASANIQSEGPLLPPTPWIAIETPGTTYWEMWVIQESGAALDVQRYATWWEAEWRAP